MSTRRLLIGAVLAVGLGSAGFWIYLRYEGANRGVAGAMEWANVAEARESRARSLTDSHHLARDWLEAELAIEQRLHLHNHERWSALDTRGWRLEITGFRGIEAKGRDAGDDGAVDLFGSIHDAHARGDHVTVVYQPEHGYPVYLHVYPGRRDVFWTYVARLVEVDAEGVPEAVRDALIDAPRRTAAAVAGWAKLAEEGDPMAQLTLGHWLSSSLQEARLVNDVLWKRYGIAQNTHLRHAWAWLSLAAEQGIGEAVRLRDAVAVALGDEGREAAGKLLDDVRAGNV